MRRRSAPEEHRDGLRQGLVVEPEPLAVRLLSGSTVRARVAAVGYVPSEGDRVLVGADEGTWFVVGVLKAGRGPRLSLPDGSTVDIDGRSLAVRDEAGRLMVRYADGRATVEAAEGDLELSAPRGDVVLQAGGHVRVDARGRIEQRARAGVLIEAGDSSLRIEPRRTLLASPRTEMRSEEVRAEVGHGAVVARHLAATATSLVHNVERYERSAEQTIERARRALVEVADTWRIRAGRLRGRVDDTYSMTARRTTITSDDDTAIDGKRVLLG